MSKVFESFAGSRIPAKSSSRARKLRMTLLLALVVSWTSVVLEMDTSGALADYLCCETITQAGWLL